MANSQPMQPAPPAAQQAERALIGAVLINSDALHDARSIVKSEDFYNKAQGALFGMMLRMSDAHKEIDFVTVAEELATLGKLSDVGGEAGLAALINEVPSTVYAATYAEQIAQAAERRRALRMATALAQMAQRGAEPAEMIECAQKFIEGTRAGGDAEVHDMRAALTEMYNSVGRIRNGETVGIVTGLPDVDRVIKGFLPGQLTSIFAPSGEGKSTLAAQWALHAAEQGYRVLYVTTEMGKGQIVTRWAAGRARIDRGALYDMTDKGDDATARLYRAGAELERLPIHFITEAISLAQLRVRIAQLRPALVVVDHVRHLVESARKGETEVEFVDRLYRDIKLMSERKGFECHMLTVQHALKSAGVIGHLTLNDMIGSRAPNQDFVFGLYRPGRHGESGNEHLAQLYLLKHRDGAEAQFDLIFVPERACYGQLQKGLQVHG